MATYKVTDGHNSEVLEGTIEEVKNCFAACYNVPVNTVHARPVESPRRTMVEAGKVFEARADYYRHQSEVYQDLAESMQWSNG